MLDQPWLNKVLLIITDRWLCTQTGDCVRQIKLNHLKAQLKCTSLLSC